MESNLKCFFLKGKYRASDDFLVLILLIFGGLRYFFYYLCTNLIINTYVFCFICILLQTLGYYLSDRQSIH